MKEYTFNRDREEKNEQEKKIGVGTFFDYLKVHATTASLERGGGGLAGLGRFYRSLEGGLIHGCTEA